MAQAQQVLYEGSYVPVAPAVDGDNVLLACATTGLLLKLDTTSVDSSSAISVIGETNGQPGAITLSVGGEGGAATGEMFIADQGSQAILRFDWNSEEPPVQVVEQFEGRQLKGPSSICFDRDGELVFADSGAFGESNLGNPQAAVYRTIHGRQQVVQVSASTLAGVSAVAYSATSGCIFVAETHANRIVRYFQRPEGVYHGSVFLQLSGGIGPSALAIDQKTGNIFVASSDVPSVSNQTEIKVFSPQGVPLETNIVVEGSEVSGIAFAADGTSLIVTEKSLKRVYKVPLQ